MPSHIILSTFRFVLLLQQPSAAITRTAAGAEICARSEIVLLQLRIQVGGSKFCVAQIGHFVDCDLETVPLRIELSNELEVVLVNLEPLRILLLRVLLAMGGNEFMESRLLVHRYRVGIEGCITTADVVIQQGH